MNKNNSQENKNTQTNDSGNTSVASVLTKTGGTGSPDTNSAESIPQKVVQNGCGKIFYNGIFRSECGSPNGFCDECKKSAGDKKDG